MQIGSRVSAAASRRGTGIVRCRECALACFASNTQEHFVCLRVCVYVCERADKCLRVCPAAALSGGGNGSQRRVVLHGESISDN